MIFPFRSKLPPVRSIRHKVTGRVVFIVVVLDDLLGSLLEIRVIQPFATKAFQEHQLIVTLATHSIALAPFNGGTVLECSEHGVKGRKVGQMKIALPRAFVHFV